MNEKIVRLASFIVLVAMAVTIGCGEKKDPRKIASRSKSTATRETTAPKAGALGPTGGKVDLSRPATITGIAVLESQAPERTKFDLSKDAWCAANYEVWREDVLVSDDGGLQNVVAYLEGLDRYEAQFPLPAEPARLVQKGCHYIPHVLVLRAGQDLEVVNADETSHNYHFIGRRNDEINKTQPKPSTDLVKLESPEVGAEFKCDIHPWMQASVHVFAHPCFAVSARDGRFSIAKVPPGTYRLHLVHEMARPGRDAIEISIGPGETRDIGKIAFSL